MELGRGAAAVATATGKVGDLLVLGGEADAVYGSLVVASLLASLQAQQKRKHNKHASDSSALLFFSLLNSFQRSRMRCSNCCKAGGGDLFVIELETPIQ